MIVYERATDKTQTTHTDNTPHNTQPAENGERTADNRQHILYTTAQYVLNFEFYPRIHERRTEMILQTLVYGIWRHEALDAEPVIPTFVSCGPYLCITQPGPPSVRSLRLRSSGLFRLK